MERAFASVDLGAIERNCQRLRSLLRSGTQLCAVVKADGYGHGALQVGKAAVRGGAEMLAVATAEEALSLRAGGYGGPLLILGAMTDSERRKALEAGAEVVAWTREFASDFPSVHIEFDTGISRLGSRDRSLVAELVRLPQVVGLMTHFATADASDQSFLREQLRQFMAVARDFPDLLVHCANSAATLSSSETHMGMVRCGVAIYGLDPFQVDPFAQKLEPALELRSWIASVRRIKTGETVGYGRRWRATGSRWIGTVPVGYGDGLHRAVRASRSVLVRGRKHDIAGVLSMDNLAIDLGAATEAEIGDAVTFIGVEGAERILAEDIALQTGTINYEIPCSLSPRVPRVYVGSWC
jgi:alanine racemase